MKRLLMTLVVGVALAAFAAPAHAAIYTFACITSNDVTLTQCGIGEAQLQVEVTAGLLGTVDFKFTNNVGSPASIADVYFDDDGTLLLALASITDSGAGVAFSSPATPGDLPGGNNASPAFETTPGFSADSDAPVASNGVNTASEWVTINFTLQGGQTFGSTLAALDDGSLRIGLHVQAIGEEEQFGGSESFVNNPGTPVPEPGTLLLLGAGLTGLAARRRRR